MNAGRQATNLVVTLVLASVLGPSAFGLVAMAMVFVFLAQLLAQQGVGPALIQREAVTDEHYTAGFWLVLGAATVLTVGALLGSGWWADLNNEEQLAPVLRALSPILILRALIVVPDAILRRDLDFKPLAVRTNTASLIGGLVGIAAAVLGAGVWALVIQQLLTAAVETLVVWLAVSWRPTWAFPRDAYRDLVGYSWRSTAASMGVVATRRADALIIGLVLGATTVGLYRLAARLVDTLMQSIQGSIRAVSLPDLARLQSDPPAFRARIRQLQMISSVAMVIPLAALAACGPTIIEILGDEWTDASVALAPLCLAGVARSLGQLSGPTLQAAGRPGALAIVAWITAAATIATFVIISVWVDGRSANDQVIALAIGTVGLAVASALLGTSVVAGVTGVSVADYAVASAPGALGGAIGYAAGALVALVLDDIPALLTLGAAGTASLTASTLTVLAVSSSIRQQAIDGLATLRSRTATAE